MKENKRFGKIKNLILISALLIFALAIAVNSQRQPSTGSDDGTWGTVLNQYLNVSLNLTGGIRTDLNLTVANFSLLTPCSNGQLMKFSNGGIVCANDLQSTATINNSDAIFQNLNITFNLTVLGNINATKINASIDCSLLNGGTDLDFCVDTGSVDTFFNNENWTTLYITESLTRWNLANTTSREASYFINSNWSTLYNTESLTRWNLANTTIREASYFLNQNWTTLYNLEALTRWNVANTTARETSYFNFVNNLTYNNSLLNSDNASKFVRIVDGWNQANNSPDLRNGTYANFKNISISGVGNISASYAIFTSINVTNISLVGASGSIYGNGSGMCFGKC